MRSASWQLRSAVVVGVVGLIALVVGIVWSVHTSATSFGWFAYAPASDQGTFPRFVSDQELAAWGTAVVGLLLLVGAAGFALGRRYAATEPA